VGEGAERSEAGEGSLSAYRVPREPLTRLNLTSFDLATLSHKGRG